MIIAVDYTPILTGVVSFIFGGGLVTAIVALYKVKPEAGQIVVTAAQGALVVQTGVIENLQKEIQRLGEEVENLKAKLTERDQQIIVLQTKLLSVSTFQDVHEKQIHDLENPK
jgi:predicted RNase H-like nuclease (RuvC/YqgF family)